MARKVLLLSVVVLASFVLAQGRPPGAARTDAGVPTARAAPVDAGVVAPAASGPTPELERLRKEVAELRLRTAELERQNQSKADALDAQFEKLNKQLEAMKGQLTKLNDAEDRRADAEEAAQAKKAATAAATTSLNNVLGVLSSGNTSGVEASLQYAQGAFTGNAQRYVQLARSAVASGDLTSARGYLILALMESDSQR